MILPLGATSDDTRHPFAALYGYVVGRIYRGRSLSKKSNSAKDAVWKNTKDTVCLSRAAQRILDQAERLRTLRNTME